MSQSIVRLIARIFWVKADSGLGRCSATKHLFNPLRSETIYYIVTCIWWCLKEYESGAHCTVKANQDYESECSQFIRANTNLLLDVYHRFSTLWHQQSQIKRDAICAILTERVKSYVARLDGDVSDEEPEEDPHKDDLSALEAYKEFLPTDLRARLEQQNFSGLQLIGSDPIDPMLTAIMIEPTDTREVSPV